MLHFPGKRWVIFNEQLVTNNSNGKYLPTHDLLENKEN